jgi:hypothetical protein
MKNAPKNLKRHSSPQPTTMSKKDNLTVAVIVLLCLLATLADNIM